MTARKCINRAKSWSLVSLVLFICSLTFASTAEAQFSNGYSYRVEVDIVDAEVNGGPHANFPMLISSTVAELRTTANGGNVENANGYDIIFTSDAAGTNQLAHEIERYVATTGEIIFWVRVESLAATTSIYMFYGNSSIGTFQGDVTSNGATGVWDNNYEAVWHMTEVNAVDSTAAGHDGTAGGNVAVTPSGSIGSALTFDSNGDQVDVGTWDPSNSNLTLSAWVHLNAYDATHQIILAKRDSHSISDMRWQIHQDFFGVLQLYAPGSFATFPGVFLTSGSWNHVVVTHTDGGTPTLYLDGTQIAGSNAMTWGTDPGATIRIGRTDQVLESFNGPIDEVRISDTVRSATWITTEYNNQLSPPAFYTFRWPSNAVNSTGDSGDATPGDGFCDTGGVNSDGDFECTLRAAIEETNAAAGADNITFNIPTSDPGYSAAPLFYTIQPGSALPPITGQLDILGNTQPDFPGTPIIVLDGVSAGAGARGVQLFAGSDSSTIRGLVIANFDGRGIYVDSSNNTIAGNWIGLAADGVTAAGNGGKGIDLLTTANNTTIGGTTAVDRNVISANNGEAIEVNSSGNLIIGNYIGTDASGAVAGVGNDNDGIQLSGDDNTVGGTVAAERNIIAGNLGRGIDSRSPYQTRFLGNSIHSNGGLGIDLGNDGVTLNDPGDPDAGANDLLNFPELTAAVASGGNVTVDFDLDVPAGDYRIEFFTNPSGTDPSGHGEGEAFAGSVNINHPGGGSQTFSHNFPGAVGDDITATTTTCTDGTCTAFLRTSEFSEFETAVGVAVTSAVAEISPNDVTTSSTGNSFSYDIQATIAGDDTGVNRVAITVPGGFGAPTVTDVQVNGGSVAYTDNTSGNDISVDLTAKVTTSSRITVLFDANAPGTEDLVGADFLSTVDDTGTALAAQSTTEGNGDADAGDNNSWTVTTTDPTLIGRYCFNEAGSGQAPASVLDDQASPLNLGITYGAPVAWSTHASGNRGLNAASVPHTGFVQGLTAGTKYETNLDGANAATLTWVADIQPTGSVQMLGGFYDNGFDGEIANVLFRPGGGIRAAVRYGTNRRVWVDWFGTFDDGVRRTFHLVWDTSQATDTDRVRLYVDGVDQGAGSIGGSPDPWPSSGDGLDFDSPASRLGFLANPNGNLDLRGTVYHFAAHNAVLTNGEIATDAAALLINDDCGLSSSLAIVKRAFLPDGTPIASGSIVPNYQEFKYLLYVNNSDLARSDLSVQDVLNSAFQYQAGTIQVDNSVAACAAATCTAAEELAIFNAVDNASFQTDAVDGDFASYTAPNIDVGDENAGNLQLDINPLSVLAILFSVKMP